MITRHEFWVVGEVKTDSGNLLRRKKTAQGISDLLNYIMATKCSEIPNTSPPQYSAGAVKLGLDSVIRKVKPKTCKASPTGCEAVLSSTIDTKDTEIKSARVYIKCPAKKFDTEHEAQEDETNRATACGNCHKQMQTKLADWMKEIPEQVDAADEIFRTAYEQMCQKVLQGTFEQPEAMAISEEYQRAYSAREEVFTIDRL